MIDFLKSHGEYRDDLCFKDITTIRMGGPIRHFVMPHSMKDLQEILSYLSEHHIDHKIVGNGSNLICATEPYEGVVISLKRIDGCRITGEEIYCEAGMQVPKLAMMVAREGLSGLEFASGIPGNIGGTVFMNAGAYKRSMADVIEEVYVLKEGQPVWMKKDELDLSYRHSLFQEHPEWTVLAVKMKLKKNDPARIEEVMKERLQRRKDTQPLNKPSAGSCFRNPEGTFAWKLIEEIGYRGYRINDVAVSDKHANFIVNEGNGTAEDYLKIVEEIKEKVKDRYGIELKMEAERFHC